MIQLLLLSNLLSNAIYLGYNKSATNASTFSLLVGSRMGMELHNLNKTINYLGKQIKLLQMIWARFGFVWIVSRPTVAAVINYLHTHTLLLLRDYMFFWNQRWTAGLFTNSTAYLHFVRFISRFPNFIFFTDYTTTFQYFSELKKSSLLFAGVVDTTSSIKDYIYYVNGNEKSIRSSTYLSTLLIFTAIRAKFYSKKGFLFKYI